MGHGLIRINRILIRWTGSELLNFPFITRTMDVVVSSIRELCICVLNKLIDNLDKCHALTFENTSWNSSYKSYKDQLICARKQVKEKNNPKLGPPPIPW